jgi:hypothetical protein
MLIRFMNPTTGMSNIKALFHFPLIKGTNNPPMINMNAGGTVSIIVILSSLHDGPQYVFCCKNEGHTGYKSIYSIKFEPPFAAKMRMLKDKELNDKQNNQR